MHRKGSGGSTHSKGGAGNGAAGADASEALHLVRVKAVVVEEIWVAGSSKAQTSSASSSSSSTSSRQRGGRKSSLGAAAAAGRRPSAADDDTPPTLRFILDAARDERRASAGTDGAKRLSNERPTSGGRPGDSAAAAAGAGARAGSVGGGGGGDLSVGLPPPAPAPVLALTRTKRRMCVTVVPEPSAVSEMVRSFSRKIGVDVAGPQPPRVLGR